MKKLLAILLIIVLTKISFAQTSLSGTAIGLRYDNNSNIYSAQPDGTTYIGDLTGNPYTYYVLCIFDLEQLGGVVNKVNSGDVTLRLDQTYGYGGGLWEAGFITQDVSNSSYYDQIVAIRGMSGTQAQEMTSIVLPISMSSIVSNKIIVGVKRVNGGLQKLVTWSASIDAVAVPRVTLNVTYNTGTGNIVAYVGSTYSAPTAPVSVRALENSQITIAPLTASIPSYQLVYNENQAPLNKSVWYVKNSNNTFQRTLTTSTNTFSMLKSEDNWIYEAQMKKLFNVTFTGYSSITVNGTSYASPTTTQVVEQNSVTASAQTYSSNNVNFTFDSWKKDGVTYTAAFTPTDHGSYNAVYRAKPSNSGEYVHFSSAVGQPIVVYWTDNTNPNVTLYKIYRKVKHNGVVGPETYIGSVNKGVGSFTDYDYLLTSTYSDDLIWYDVREYYSSTDPYIVGDYSEALYTEVYGKMVLAKISDNATAQSQSIITAEIPAEYSIGNFPNPFNPTTTIKYQLPEAGMVTLKVYDILGKEVAELVNENKAAGDYEVNFDASRLTSGVYIYTVTAGKYTESKKMILAK